MNNLLPLRIGEFIRVHVTGKKLNVTRSGVLATVVIERLFDGLSYVILFLITIIFLPFPNWAKRSIFAGSILFTGALIFLFFLGRHQEKALKFFLKIPLPEKFKIKLQNTFINFIGGLKILGNFRTLLRIFLLSLIVWTFEGCVFYNLFFAFNLKLSLFHGFLVMIIIGTGAILPTAPGFIGTVEFLGVTSLSFLGVDKNQAFGYIITLHMLQILSIAFWGILGIIKEKISLSELIRLEKQKLEPAKSP